MAFAAVNIQRVEKPAKVSPRESVFARKLTFAYNSTNGRIEDEPKTSK
jgi:hypothetical protein